MTGTGSSTILTSKRIWLWNTIFWMILWLFSVWNNYQWANSVGSEFTWNIVFSWSFPYYVTMILSGPLIFQLYRKWNEHSYVKHALRHLIPALISGFVHQLALNVFYAWLKPSSPDEPHFSFSEILAARYEVGFVFSMNGFLFYWLCLILIFLLDLYGNYRRQELANAALSSELNKAKFQTLQSQLQPHFLFNAFNSLSMMARQQKHKEVVNMIAKVSQLLRETLNLGEQQQIPLEKELEMVKHYLAIEQIRFRDTLTIELNITEEASKKRVPALFLQPIVENAFQHGISKTEGKSHLDISASLLNERLEISIINSGPTLPNDWTLEDNLGIGLSNVLKRLDLVFPDQYTFELTNLSDGSGVKVNMQLPLE